MTQMKIDCTAANEWVRNKKTGSIGLVVSRYIDTWSHKPRRCRTALAGSSLQSRTTMREILHTYANRLAGNRLPGLLRELADAIDEEEDVEQLRRLYSSLIEMGGIARSRYQARRESPNGRVR